VTLERVGESENPADDETNVYSWRDGTHTAASRPERAPTFSCCENNFRVTSAKITGAANTATAPNGASALRVDLELKVRLDCARQQQPGEGTRPPAACVITFLKVSSSTKPRFSRNPGGALMLPAAERTWWTAVEELCDGRGHSATLKVSYIAHFPFLGVPRDVAGEAASEVVLRFDAKAGGGSGHEVTVGLAQLNQDRPLQARVTGQRRL